MFRSSEIVRMDTSLKDSYMVPKMIKFEKETNHQGYEM
jgi:hypothetical protein